MLTRLTHCLFLPLVGFFLFGVAQAQAPKGAAHTEIMKQIAELRELVRSQSKSRALPPPVQVAWDEVENALGKLKCSPDNTISGDDAVQKTLRGVSDAIGKLPKRAWSMDPVTRANTQLNKVIDLAKRARAEAEKPAVPKVPNKPWTATSPLAKLVELAGFTYDAQQDIIVSRMDPWQRHFGYAWGMDMASAALGMVIDAEPLYFDYGGKEWLIELWKGQYVLETGCEIGVYNRALPLLPVALRPDPRIGLFSCASNAELLTMELTLSKNGATILRRGPERHWWLTGFKWGEFAEPEDLKMDVRITLPNAGMRDAFLGALIARGYKSVTVSGTVVSFTFDKPHKSQPIPRFALRGAKQAKNKLLVEAYRAATKAAGLTSNDPNAISETACKQVYDIVSGFINVLSPNGGSRKG